MADPFFSEFPDSDEGESPSVIQASPPAPIDYEDEDISYAGAPPKIESPAEPPAWLQEALDADRSDDLLPIEDAPPEDPRDTTEPRAMVGSAVEVTDPIGNGVSADPFAEEPSPPQPPTPESPATDSPGSDEVVNGSGHDVPLHPAKAWLEFMSGPERGQAVAIGPQLTVGKSDACGMSVPGDSRMSPRHCQVERTPDGFILRDAGSTTGTVVNGKRIQELQLRGGETIMVGRTVLRFRMEA